MSKTASAKRALVVEDESAIAILLEDMLADLGFEVTATASTVSEALAAIEGHDFDFAVLDINLAGQRSDPVAACWRASASRCSLPLVMAPPVCRRNSERPPSSPSHSARRSWATPSMPC